MLSSAPLRFRFARIAACLLLSAAALPAREPRTNPFFAFDNGVGRDLGSSPERQAEVLSQLGYAGIGYTGTTHLAARLAAFQAKHLRVFSLYVPIAVDRPEPLAPEILDALPQLKGTGTALWVYLPGKAPNEEPVIAAIRRLADAAASFSVRVVLYPHKGFFVATAEEGLRLLEKVGRPEVGITINLCHELAAGHADRLTTIVEACGPRLALVSINGADPTGGWNELIRPLGEGSYDVAGFLRTLDRVGYRGPIGLQCYNVKGDQETNLRKSLEAWRRYAAESR